MHNVAPTLAEQVRKHNKENTISVQNKYSFACHCKDRVSVRQKEFVKDKSLLALNKVLFYIIVSKINYYKVCTQHFIKHAIKLQ